MLTDTQLKNLKPTGKLYKLVDRDGLYVAVTPSGVVSFRYDYRLNGRRETLVFGQYGPEGLTLGEAREKLIGVKREIAAGKSPAKEKQRSIQKSKAAKTFGEFSTLWLKEYRMADSTRDMRKSVIDRDIEPEFGRRLLKEIAAEDLRALCERVKTQRNAPATAVHIRDIVAQVFRFAIERGHKVANPADDVRASSIATFKPKDRALSPDEIRIFFHELDLVPTLPTIRLALKLVLLTLVRKGELLNATWDEMDFVGAKWIIPAQRMKARRPHVIYLPDQAMDIMIALKTCAGGSNFILPSRYEGDKGMSNNTLNRVITVTVEHAKKKDLLLDDFTVHDLRRTGSTLLHEAGFNTDWIEKCLAHEQKGVRAIYNKAEYADQRKDMLQQWANMVDAWIAGKEVTPIHRPTRAAA
jgi:integrase